MTPEEQLAQSQKYIGTQYCFIKQPDGRLSLFVAYGSIRTYQGTFTDEKLLDLIRKDFDKRLSLNEAKKKHEEIIREQADSGKIDFDLDGFTL